MDLPAAHMDRGSWQQRVGKPPDTVPGASPGKSRRRRPPKARAMPPIHVARTPALVAPATCSVFRPRRLSSTKVLGGANAADLDWWGAGGRDPAYIEGARVRPGADGASGRRGLADRSSISGADLCARTPLTSPPWVFQQTSRDHSRPHSRR